MVSFGLEKHDLNFISLTFNIILTYIYEQVLIKSLILIIFQLNIELKKINIRKKNKKISKFYN